MGARARVAGPRRSRSGPDAGRRTRHMNNWSAEAWRRVVENAPEGIVICDAAARDCPVLFVNSSFADMCGYPAAALLGTNLRILQGTDRDQEARTRLLVAVRALQDAQVGAQQRRRRIAAHVRERGVDEQYRAVAGRGIADHDAFGCVLNDAAPGLRRPVVHVSRPASSVRAGAAAARASNSRARPHSAEAWSPERTVPARPCRRTRRRLDAGCGSASRCSISSMTLARLLHTGSMSQPADSACRARVTTSP